MKRRLHQFFSMVILLSFLESATAVQFETPGDALKKFLKSSKVDVKKVKVGKRSTQIFYRKKGKKLMMAALEDGMYPPDCSHTWVIGLTKSCKVKGIRVVEMKCPHAFPTKKASFLDQFKGKGPKHAKRLKNKISTIAKATGSSELTAEAVSDAILGCKKVKKRL